MSLFWQEMRKIWRPGILAALAVLGVLFFFLRPKFYIEFIPRSQNFDNALLLVERYGPLLTAEVRPELDAIYEDLEENFDREVKQLPEAAEAGITDCASYKAWEQGLIGTGRSYSGELYSELWQLYMPVNDFGLIMDLYDGFLDGTFDMRNSPFLDNHPPQAQARILELEESIRTEGFSFLPAGISDSTWKWGKYLSMWTVLSVILLLSPTLVRDRLRRTNAMQWASRRGRRVVRTQAAAALVSALLVALVNLVFYFVFFAAQGALPFWDCPLFCGNGGDPWFDWTYGQFILVLIGMNFVFALVAGTLAVFLSQYSANYVPMLLKAVPLFLVVGLGVVGWALSDPFFTNKSNYGGMDNPKGSELFCVLLLLAVGLGACAWTCVRQKKREL